ncbi:MAG: hypothetical protein ACRDHM_04600 [Actinomycetota bacterium]
MIVVVVSILLAMIPISPASASHRFGDAAGWVKATGPARHPIRVWSQAALGVDVGASIEPWNWLAGWRLFRRVGSRRAADVAFIPSTTPDTWTQCSPTYLEPFHLCIVWVADPSVEMSRHELGHTLGFADHIQAERYAEGRHISAKVCDASEHPEYSAYHGVMSYCDWTDDFRGWFGPKDTRMLKRAGYLQADALDAPSERSSRAR